jgi:hypothetical protein
MVERGHCFDTETVLGSEGSCRLAKNEERPDRHGDGPTGDQVRVGSANGGSGTNGVVNNRDPQCPHPIALINWQPVTHRKQPLGGRIGVSFRVECFETECASHSRRDLCAAGHGAADGIDPMRHQPSSELELEGAQGLALRQRAVEIKPALAVKAGFHPEMPTTPHQEREQIGCVGAHLSKSLSVNDIPHWGMMVVGPGFEPGKA